MKNEVRVKVVQNLFRLVIELQLASGFQATDFDLHTQEKVWNSCCQWEEQNYTEQGNRLCKAYKVAIKEKCDVLRDDIATTLADCFQKREPQNSSSEGMGLIFPEEAPCKDEPSDAIFEDSVLGLLLGEKEATSSIAGTCASSCSSSASTMSEEVDGMKVTSVNRAFTLGALQKVLLPRLAEMKREILYNCSSLPGSVKSVASVNDAALSALKAKESLQAIDETIYILNHPGLWAHDKMTMLSTVRRNEEMIYDFYFEMQRQ